MIIPGHEDYMAEEDLRVLQQAADILKSMERVKNAESVAKEKVQVLENFTNGELEALKQNLARRNASAFDTDAQT